MLPEVRGVLTVYRCHIQNELLNDNTSHAFISTIRIEPSVYISYTKRKLLMNTHYMLSLMQLGLIFLSQKTQKKRKYSMNKRHMFPQVRVEF